MKKVEWQALKLYAIIIKIMDLIGTHRLGTRAFLLFLSRRLRWPLIVFVILGALWTQRDRVPVLYHVWTDYSFNIFLLGWIGFMVFILLRSFFEYRGYSFRFDDEFFYVTRGYFLKQEMGVVYHQIQHVTVRRSMLDRMVGVGHLIITTNFGGGDPALSEIVLPALDKTKARFVQRELLRKAHRPISARASVVSSEDEEDTDESEEEE